MSARPIRTYYMKGDEVLKITASGDEQRAVAMAVSHAWADDYNAPYVLVYDEERGRDLAVMTRTPRSVHILYKRDSKVK